MNLNEFLIDLIDSVETERETRKENPDDHYPYPETVFTEIAKDFLSDKGLIQDQSELAYYKNRKYGKISAYAFSEDGTTLDLINTVYYGDTKITELPSQKVKQEFNKVLDFIRACCDGNLLKHGQPLQDVQIIASVLQEKFDEIDTIRIFILTDAKTVTKKYKETIWNSKNIRCEVIDLERYYSLVEAGVKKEIIIHFEKDFGKRPPCIYMQGNTDEEYDYALAILPGDVLNALYHEYGSRILEANVRSFLSFRGKINKGIQKTLIDYPENFFAYNNGLVIVADKIEIKKDEDTGLHYISGVQGLQIVNGGQTTASMFFAKRKDSSIKLNKVRVAAKFIIPKQGGAGTVESLYSDISRYANTQNIVRTADLSSNSEYQRKIDELAQRSVLSDGRSKVFYERTKGSFNVFLQKDAKTETQRKKLKELYPVVIDKTDLAKYLNSWEKRPYEVARGAQKNFAAYTDRIEERIYGKDRTKEESIAILNSELNDNWFQTAVAKAFLFKEIGKIVSKIETQSKSTINAYAMAFIADKFVDRFDLKPIWRNQGLSDEQRKIVRALVGKINENLIQHQDGRLFTEWAKKPECWDALRADAEAIKVAVLNSYS